MSCVITCSDCYPLSNQINLLMVIMRYDNLAYYLDKATLLYKYYVVFRGAKRARVMIFNATFDNSYIVAVGFICGGIRRKPPTCRKSLTNLIT